MAECVTNLDTVIRRALKDNQAGMDKYEQYLYWGKEVLNDFNFDVNREVKVIQPKMTDKMTIEFPNDYVDWVRIGVVHLGYIMAFTQDYRIAHQYDCGIEEARKQFQPQVATVRDWWKSGTPLSLIEDNRNYWNEYVGREFGASTKHNGIGFFRVNKKQRHFQFASLLFSKDDTYYMEYIVNKDTAGPNTAVHPYIAKAIKHYINWQAIEYNDKIAVSQKDRKERIYWDEFNRARSRMYDWDVQEIIQATWDNMYMIPV